MAVSRSSPKSMRRLSFPCLDKYQSSGFQDTHAHEKDNPLPSALMPQAPSALPDQTRMSDSVRQRLVCKHHTCEACLRQALSF